jgi:hypothetical protein
MPTSPIHAAAMRLQDISRPGREEAQALEFEEEQERIFSELQLYGRVLSPIERVFQPYTDPIKGGEEEGAFRALKDTLTAGFAGGGLSAIRPGGLAKLFDPRVPASEIHALYGMKRFPDFYHGTPSEEAASQIRREGFTKGKSAELELPGASLSRDPSVSAKFAQAMTPTQAQDRMVKVIPEVSPSEVRNLRPSEYLVGVQGDKIYNKPNVFFKEAETFLPRNQNLPPDIEAKAHALAKEISEAQEDYTDLLFKGLSSLHKGLSSPGYQGLTNEVTAASNKAAALQKEFVKLTGAPDYESIPKKTVPVKVRDLTESEATRAFEAKRNLAGHEAALSPEASKEDMAKAIIDTRGDRGAHEKIMSRIIDTPPHVMKLRFGVNSRRAARLKDFTSYWQKEVRRTREQSPGLLFKNTQNRHEDIDIARQVFDEARALIGKPWKNLKEESAGTNSILVPNNPSIQDVRDTLDDLSREYIKERDVLAEQIIKTSKVKAKGQERSLSGLENRVRDILSRTASRNRTGASVDPALATRAKLTIDDVDALNEAGAGISVENVKDVTNQDILDLVEAYKSE